MAEHYDKGYKVGLETALKYLKRVRIGPMAATTNSGEFVRGFKAAVYLIKRDVEDKIGGTNAR